MSDEHISFKEDDDGFEDCVPGGLRPNYKIPILLTEMKECVLDHIIQSESNSMSCASCNFDFHDFPEMEKHFETCSEKPSRKNRQEYKMSQYHTNALILALKHMYKAGISGLDPVKTDMRLPFHMESFAGANVEHHYRLVGNLVIVTCRMCKCQYIHREDEPFLDSQQPPAGLTNDNHDFDPSLIKNHVKLCPRYEKTHEQFLANMEPFIKKVKHHYCKLFDIYQLIRSGIYGSDFKVSTTSDPFSWREMATIYEVDETNRGIQKELERAGQSWQFQHFDFKLHNIEPESVDFVKTNYFHQLNDTIEGIFFTRVTGL